MTARATPNRRRIGRRRMGRRRVASALARAAPHALVLAPRDADARVMANIATDASAATDVVVEVAARA